MYILLNDSHIKELGIEGQVFAAIVFYELQTGYTIKIQYEDVLQFIVNKKLFINV